MKMKNYIDTNDTWYQPENYKQTIGKDYVAVRSNSFSLYKAFKEECEKLGWIYNDKFSEFSEERALVRELNCMYFSYEFDNAYGQPAFSLSYTNLKSFQLPQQWYEALKSVKEMIDTNRYLHKVELNCDYEAIVDTKLKQVKVGCQRIPFAKVLEVADIINKNSKAPC